MTVEEKLVKIAENTPKVYEAGKAEGIAEGKQAEYDSFWDEYQDYGKRTSYTMYDGTFAGKYWTDALFRPKYSIKPSTAYMMFRSTAITDLTREDISLDFSECTDMQYTFAYAALLKVPPIDMSSATTTTSTFSYYKGTDLSIIASANTIFAPTTFDYVENLKNLVIEGIVATAFNVKRSKNLTRDSIVSIINALSTTTTGLTVTFSKEAVDNAFATAEGAADGSTSAEWLALVATRSNWTIALA